jgi:hypothetical protein
VAFHCVFYLTKGTFYLQDFCFALPLQLCLVSSSPSKVGQLSFKSPQVQETISVIHHAPQPLLCKFGLLLHLCSQPLCLTPLLLTNILAPLGGWLLAPPKLSVIVPCPALTCLIRQLDPPPFSEAGSVFHSTPILMVNSIHCLCFSVLFGMGEGRFNLPRGCTGLCFWRICKRIDCTLCFSPMGSADLLR